MEIDDAPITQIGGPTNRFFVLSCVIKSCPNRTHAVSGVDKNTFQKGYTGNQNFGCLLAIDGSNIVPLLKWRDVVNGGREGLQVSLIFYINQYTIQQSKLLLYVGKLIIYIYYIAFRYGPRHKHFVFQQILF